MWLLTEALSKCSLCFSFFLPFKFHSQLNESMLYERERIIAQLCSLPSTKPNKFKVVDGKCHKTTSLKSLKTYLQKEVWKKDTICICLHFYKSVTIHLIMVITANSKLEYNPASVTQCVYKCNRPGYETWLETRASTGKGIRWSHYN